MTVVIECRECRDCLRTVVELLWWFGWEIDVGQSIFEFAIDVGEGQTLGSHSVFECSSNNFDD